MPLWDDYPSVQVLTGSPSWLRHDDLVQLLAELHAASPRTMSVKRLGESFEGRSISCVQLGNGHTRVLAWSQMHGDEPTHTAVLLAVVNLLQRFPAHPSSKAILTGSTLYLIPMLNPDGVEHYTRRNAQDIDINRDARHLQSPEGRLLRQAVEAIRPDFALNLHNQRPRTSSSASSLQVAAVSLLVPPVDCHATETDQTSLAKLVASSLLQAVRPHCEGMISRYDADFMPRCFGEWVQQQGVATLTIEAGGWSVADLDSTPLGQLHFVGLVGALEAIATENYLQADPAEYDSLPRSGKHDLFDLMLRGVTVSHGGKQPPFVADLGINYAAPESRRSPPVRGLIEDLGDLCETSGKTLVDGTGLICLPGRISYAPDISPGQLPDPKRVRDFLAMGVTTVIGRIDLADSVQLDVLSRLNERLDLPINLGFVAFSMTVQEEQSTEMLKQIVSASSRGILGVLRAGLSAEASRFLQCLQIPLLHEDELPVTNVESISLEDFSLTSHDVAVRLGLHGRGGIKLGATADLLLLRLRRTADSRPVIHWSDLHQVMVAGTVVFDTEEVIGCTSGTLLSNRLTKQFT